MEDTFFNAEERLAMLQLAQAEVRRVEIWKKLGLSPLFDEEAESVAQEQFEELRARQPQTIGALLRSLVRDGVPLGSYLELMLVLRINGLGRE